MLQGLRADWTGLLLGIQRAKNETENQILIRDSKGLTEDQIKEYRQSFDHFDRVSHPQLCFSLPPSFIPPSSLPKLIMTQPSFSHSHHNSQQDNSGQLDKNEYRACLLSLGYKLGADPVTTPLHCVQIIICVYACCE